MQTITREMNLSETAFAIRKKDAFNLRWFTPSTEVDLCGHAMFATAHILREEGYLGGDEPARFSTKSETISAVERRSLSDGFSFRARGTGICPRRAFPRTRHTTRLYRYEPV
jgi:predicted PhzF superfamily epimerase YddE/YHI9